MLKQITFPLLVALSLLFIGCGDNNKANDSIDKSSVDKSDIKKANSMLSTTEYTFRFRGLDNKKYIVKADGEGFSVNNSKGKVIIFDIFATWCPPCQASASHLANLKKKYGDKLIVIGVNIEQGITDKKLLAFREEFGADYILVNSSENRRFINKIVTKYNLGERYPIPIMVMYKDGKLLKQHIGAIQEEFIDSDIQNALGR